MNNIAIKSFILSITDFPKDVKYVIYGIKQVADIYYEIIESKFGSDAIDFFVDSSIQASNTFHGYKVIHINNLESYKKDNQVYIITSITESQDKMKRNLINLGIDESKIICNLIYFRKDYLKKYLKHCGSIYIYEQFENEDEIKNWEEKTGYYMNYNVATVTFHYSCKNMGGIYNSNENKYVITHEFKPPENEKDIIFVKSINNISKVKTLCNNPIICIDDSFSLYTKAQMYVELADFFEGTLVDEDCYRNNYMRLLEVAETKEGILICGNGPSLEKGVDKFIGYMPSFFPIVCNNLYQATELINRIKPKCYVITDQNFFQYESQGNLKGIVEYVNHNDCFFVFPRKWERLVLDRCKIDVNKAIGLEFTREHITIPYPDNLKCCIGGTVVLTMGVPIGISCNKDIYFMGCDGTKQKPKQSEMLWEYQKGVDINYLEELNKKNSLIGINTSLERSMLEIENSYKKLLHELKMRENNYYLLTHSYFPILEKEYIDTIEWRNKNEETK